MLAAQPLHPTGAATSRQTRSDQLWLVRHGKSRTGANQVKPAQSMLRACDCASIGILWADPSRKNPCDVWLEREAAIAEVQEALIAGTHSHRELIYCEVRLATMDSSLSSYRGTSTPQHIHGRTHNNGDYDNVSRQAIPVLDVQTRKHCAEVQGSPAGEGLAEEEDSQSVWSVILQRHKAQGFVGLGEVHPHS